MTTRRMKGNPHPCDGPCYHTSDHEETPYCEPMGCEPVQPSASQPPMMSDTKFTPGPWEVRIKDKKYYVATGIFIIADGIWGTIPAENPASLDANVAERMANAHLIAAAPDMYRALEHCINHLKQLEAQLFPGESDEMRKFTSRRHAEAAMKAARGERE